MARPSVGEGRAQRGPPGPKPHADAARWVSVREALGHLELALDHDRTLEVTVQRLRRTIDYAPIAFRLVPETFTVSELRWVHEANRGEPMDASNVTRRFGWMIRDGIIHKAPGKRVIGWGRPASACHFDRRRAEGHYPDSPRPTAPGKYAGVVNNERPYPWLRALVFVGLTLAMAAGPFLNQVLQHRYSPLFKPWRMYFGFGIELCEVTYIQVSQDGQERVLDRYDLLGHQPWTAAPASVRNLPDGPTIGHVAQQLCDALPARRPDIRARARCAGVRGWSPAMDANQNLCRLGPRQIEGLRPRKGRR